MTRRDSTWLLSRVADALYWIGRYLERAEHAARLLDVHTGLAVEGIATRDDWQELVDLTRDGAEYPDEWPVDPIHAARFLVAHPGNPNGISASLTVAREHARGVRGAISSELWEQINVLYWQARREVDAGSWVKHPQVFLRAVKQGAHLVHGLAEETMLHDQAVSFLRLGKHLERAANTLRLVEAKHPGLTQPDGQPDLPRCAAALRMCSAFEAYRRYYAAPVEPTRVVEMLLLSPTFPRSAFWAAARAADEAVGVGEGGSGSDVRRHLGALRAQLEFAHVDELLPDGLVHFVHSCRQRIWEVETALARRYFLRDEAPPGPGQPSFAPQQQQQQQQ